MEEEGEVGEEGKTGPPAIPLTSTPHPLNSHHSHPQSTTWCCARCGPAAALLPPEAPSTTTSDANADAAAGTGTATAGGAGAGAGPRNRYAEEIAQLYVRGGSGGGSDPPAPAVVDDDASTSSTPMSTGGGVGAPPPPEEQQQQQQVEAAAPAVPVPSVAAAEHELRWVRKEGSFGGWMDG